MSRMADALIPPYDVYVLASQVHRDLGSRASWGEVCAILHEYGADPHHVSLSGAPPRYMTLVTHVLAILAHMESEPQHRPY